MLCLIDSAYASKAPGPKIEGFGVLWMLSTNRRGWFNAKVNDGQEGRPGGSRACARKCVDQCIDNFGRSGRIQKLRVSQKVSLNGKDHLVRSDSWWFAIKW